MKLDRRQLLTATGAALLLPAAAARAATPRRLAVVMADGGWDVTFVFDPKFHTDEADGPEADEDPDNPEDREDTRTFGGIEVAVNDFKRPAVTTYFERWADRSCIVNGIWVGALAHASARVRALTGTQSQANPAWATIAGHVLGEDLPLGSVDLSGASYSGYLAASMGQIGYQAQIKGLLVDDASFPAAPTSDYTLPQFQSDATDRDAVSAYLAQRNAAFAARVRDGAGNDAMLASRTEALDRASRFRVEGRSTIEGLTLGVAPSLLEQADVAVDLLAGDLCRAVTLDSRVLWDTHDANVAQHDHFQVVFEGVDRLVTLLDDRGILDDTLVVVVSEFTRTPKLNSRGGKDHWPHASYMMVGGNVRGGRVIGGTDDRVESQTVNLVTGEVDPGGDLDKYDNISAGILAALDIDPDPWFPTIPPMTGFFV